MTRWNIPKLLSLIGPELVVAAVLFIAPVGWALGAAYSWWPMSGHDPRFVAFGLLCAAMATAGLLAARIRDRRHG